MVLFSRNKVNLWDSNQRVLITGKKSDDNYFMVRMSESVEASVEDKKDGMVSVSLDNLCLLTIFSQPCIWNIGYESDNLVVIHQVIKKRRLWIKFSKEAENLRHQGRLILKESRGYFINCIAWRGFLAKNTSVLPNLHRCCSKKKTVHQRILDLINQSLWVNCSLILLRSTPLQSETRICSCMTSRVNKGTGTVYLVRRIRSLDK